MNGLPYYKRYGRDFLEGTAGMPFELKGAYAIVLDLIYLQGGRLPDDPQYIAGHLGMSVRRWNKVRLGLIAAGKIEAENGIISNSRADKELIISRSFQDKQRENRTGSSKNNGLRKPRSDQSESEPEPDTEEKIINISTRVRARRLDDDDRLAPSDFIGACEPVDGLHWSWTTEAVTGFLSDAFSAGWSGGDMLSVARSARASLGDLPMRSTAYIARCLNQRAEALAPDIAAKPKADEGFAARLLSRRNDE